MNPPFTAKSIDILRIPRHRRLQTRLTVQFILANVLGTALIVAMLVFLTTYIVFFSPAYPQMLQADMQELGPQVAGFLEKSPIDTAQLETWLQKQRDPAPDSGPVFQLGFDVAPQQQVFAAITDARGNVLVSSPPQAFVVGRPLQSQIAADERNLFLRAMSGETECKRLSARASDQSSIATMPALSASGQVVGVGFLRVVTPFSFSRFFMDLAMAVLPSALLALFFSGIIGSLFGYLSSRALTRRISGTAIAAQQWGVGNFAAQAPTQGDDELTELSLRLNQTAQELSHLVELRQDIATLEERNRLARDLHDTVKQQVFALNMQLGAVRALLKTNPDTAEQRLVEAENLARQAQQELMSLIQELRPAYQDNRSVAAHLQEMVRGWERRTGIATQLTIAENLHGCRFSARVEMALLRIAQEALSNIARHSGATRTTLSLTLTEEETLLLTIRDNGLGFDRRLRRSLNGLGLNSMQERALSLPQGSFDVVTAPGQGTEIRVCCAGETESKENFHV
ncbi:MAG: hypothetical protein OHK0029_34400 [Armatimonadaceae bacterium]